jgi:hypothetical protein
LNSTSNFILRFYYFLEDEIESIEKMNQIFIQNELIFINNNHQPHIIDKAGSYYNLNHPQGKMIIKAVKTQTGDDYWAAALNQLQSWEEQAQLCADDFMGRLTILVGDLHSWEEILHNACDLLPGEVQEIIELKQGQLARLQSGGRRGEDFYLCGMEESETSSVAFLFRRLPLFHGSIIRLQALITSPAVISWKHHPPAGFGCIIK